jgi:hypothetical protein
MMRVVASFEVPGGTAAETIDHALDVALEGWPFELEIVDQPRGSRRVRVVGKTPDAQGLRLKLDARFRPTNLLVWMVGRD